MLSRTVCQISLSIDEIAFWQRLPLSGEVVLTNLWQYRHKSYIAKQARFFGVDFLSQTVYLQPLTYLSYLPETTEFGRVIQKTVITIFLIATCYGEIKMNILRCPRSFKVTDLVPTESPYATSY